MDMRCKKIVKKKSMSESEYEYKHSLEPVVEEADHKKITIKTKGVQVVHEGDDIGLQELGEVLASKERQSTLDSTPTKVSDHEGDE